MIGLKDTLALMAAGYKKKDIDAMAKIDEEADKAMEQDPTPAPEPDKKPEEDTTDYKKLYEELKLKNEKTEKELTDIRNDNIHKDISGDAQKKKEEDQASLLDTIKGFM